MLRTAITISLTLAAPAAAESFVADAFGLVPTAALSDDRARWAGLRVLDGQPMQVAPDATDGVVVFVGPKSLVAGKDRGHAVALATDEDGNLVADGLEADFVLGAIRKSATTRSGIASVLFRPTTLAGPYVAGATVDARQSPRAIFRVTADLANLVPFEANFPEIAVAETVSTLKTDPLTDIFGNAAADGTAATIISAAPDGSANFITAPVLEGRASGRLLLRDTSNQLTVTTTVVNQTTPGGDLILEELAYAGPVEATLWPISELKAIGLKIEPVKTSAGHLLNDGATIELVLTDYDGIARTTRGWLRDGIFETVIPTDWANGPFALRATTVLGTVDVILSEREGTARGEDLQ